MESLLGALAGCLIRGLASEVEGADIALDRVVLRVAPSRSDDPPVLAPLVIDLDHPAAEPERIHRMVELALPHRTVTRTLAQACPIVIDQAIPTPDSQDVS